MLKEHPGCNAYEGLFEPEILALKTLKFKGLGKAASWDLLYKSLFPDPNNQNDPIPSPCEHSQWMRPTSY